MAPKPTGVGAEGSARLELFKKSGLGDHYMADLDGVMIAVSQRNNKSTSGNGGSKPPSPFD